MFQKLLLGDFLGSFIRHALTVVGGFLVAKGIATAEQTSSWSDSSLTLIPGIVAYLVGQAASLFKAKKVVELKEETGVTELK